MFTYFLWNTNMDSVEPCIPDLRGMSFVGFLTTKYYFIDWPL